MKKRHVFHPTSKWPSGAKLTLCFRGFGPEDDEAVDIRDGAHADCVACRRKLAKGVVYLDRADGATVLFKIPTSARPEKG